MILTHPDASELGYCQLTGRITPVASGPFHP